MNVFNFRILRKAATAAFGFFGTLCVLSVGYSAYVGLSSVSAWQGLTVGLWTQVKDNFTDHEARIGTLATAQSKIGERVLGSSAAASVSIPLAPTEAYIQKYVDLPTGIWQVSYMGEGDLANASSWNHARWYCSASATVSTDTSGFTRLANSTWQASSWTWVFYSGYEILEVASPVRCHLWTYNAVHNNTAVSVRTGIPVAIRIK